MFLFVLFLLIAAFYNYPHLPVILPGLTVVKLAGAVVLLTALARSLATTRSLRLFGYKEAQLYLLLLLLMSVSALANGLRPGQQLYFWTYLSHLAFYFIASVIVSTEKKLVTACHWLVASILLIALTVVKDRIRWGLDRPGGIAGDPNYYALIAVCFLPLCLLGAERLKGSLRVFYVGSGIVIIAAILLGASRGGALALVISTAYAFLHLRRKIVVGSLATAVMATLLLTVPGALLERITNPGHGTQISTESRFELWSAGLKMVSDNPILGVGPALFKGESVDYSDGRSHQIAHNSYIEVAAELGLPAFVVWISIIFASWNRMRKLGKRLGAEGDDLGQWMAESFKIGLIGYVVAATFISASYVRHTWFLIFFGVVLEKVTQHREGRLSQSQKARVASSIPQPQAVQSARWSVRGSFPVR